MSHSVVPAFCSPSSTWVGPGRGQVHGEFDCSPPGAQLKTSIQTSLWLGNLWIKWFIYRSAGFRSKACQNADPSNSRENTDCLIWFVSKLRMLSSDLSRRQGSPCNQGSHLPSVGYCVKELQPAPWGQSQAKMVLYIITHTSDHQDSIFWL